MFLGIILLKEGQILMIVLTIIVLIVVLVFAAVVLHIKENFWKRGIDEELQKRKLTKERRYRITQKEVTKIQSALLRATATCVICGRPPRVAEYSTNEDDAAEWHVINARMCSGCEKWFCDKHIHKGGEWEDFCRSCWLIHLQKTPDELAIEWRERSQAEYKRRRESAEPQAFLNDLCICGHSHLQHNNDWENCRIPGCECPKYKIFLRRH